MNTNDVIDEIKAIKSSAPKWVLLATQDIKLRYRRSAIGPFWITISMAISIFSMGYLYGYLFKINHDEYFPYLASGIITWSFISSLIIEGSTIFIESESYIRNQNSHMTVYIMRSIMRNCIIFAHNMLVFVPIILLFNIDIGWNTLLIIPGIILILINALCWGTFVGIIGTRYRDFPQIVVGFMQIFFFISPVIWSVKSLPPRLQWVPEYNPFYQYVNLVRLPLINHGYTLQQLIIVLLVTVLGIMLYTQAIKKYKHRLVFWL